MIDSYRFGCIVVDGTAYRRDLIVLPSGVVPDWWRQEGHLLQLEDLAPLLPRLPRILVIGTGMFGRLKVAPSVLELLATAGSTPIIERTGIAWQRFNDCLTREEVVAGAFHLTC